MYHASVGKPVGKMSIFKIYINHYISMSWLFCKGGVGEEENITSETSGCSAHSTMMKWSE